MNVRTVNVKYIELLAFWTFDLWTFVRWLQWPWRHKCPSGGITFQNFIFTFFFLRVIIDSSMSHSIMPKISTVNLRNKEEIKFTQSRKTLVILKIGSRFLFAKLIEMLPILFGC